MFLPPEGDRGGDGDDDINELDMVNQKVVNQIVVAERAKALQRRDAPARCSRQIKHECNLRPRITKRYKCRLMERCVVANEKSMRVRVMDGARAGLGGGKILSSGFTSAAGFADIAVRRTFLFIYLFTAEPNWTYTFFIPRKEQAGERPK